MQVVKFETRYPVGRDPVDYVLVAPQGPTFNSVQTWHRVEKLRPLTDVNEKTAQSPHHIAMVARWKIIEPRYEAWKEGQDIPEDGTPLEAWGGVTKEQIATLKGMSIKTVEDVRDMAEQAIQACRWPNARKLPELAKAYLESRDSAVQAQENADLKERIAAMEEMLEAQKPKRGRPPKKETEAA